MNPTLSIQSRRQRWAWICPGFSGCAAEYKLCPRQDHQRNERSLFQRNTLFRHQSRRDYMGEGSGRTHTTRSKGLSDAVGGLLKPEVFAPRCVEPQGKERSQNESFEPSAQRIAVERRKTTAYPSKPARGSSRHFARQICFYREADSARSFLT
jgi:hypothetical protein